MGYFIEYQIFSSLEEVKILLNILDANQIPVKVENATIRFYIAETTINPLENGLIIQKRLEDKEKIDKRNQRNAELSLNNDHYMYLLPDNFIVEAVINPMEWTKEEHLLAKEILKQRKIKQPQTKQQMKRKNKND